MKHFDKYNFHDSQISCDKSCIANQFVTVADADSLFCYNLSLFYNDNIAFFVMFNVLYL